MLPDRCCRHHKCQRCAFWIPSRLKFAMFRTLAPLQCNIFGRPDVACVNRPAHGCFSRSAGGQDALAERADRIAGAKVSTQHSRVSCVGHPGVLIM